MIRRPAFLLTLLFLGASATVVFAQGTHLWSSQSFDEFEKGTPDGVAIESDGRLMPGPASQLVYSTPSSYVWSLAAGNSGETYLGTGTPATVLRVTPNGKSTTLLTTKELSVQVVRAAPNGQIYAALLPSAEIYRLDPNASGKDESTATVVFDPATTAEKPKYVWDMAFDARGRLYVATGAPAAIYRISGTGKPELFFKSDEEHIRAIAFDPAGNLIAGSDGTGLIYRVDPSGKGYVLYDAPKKEITSIAVSPSGSIYASAVGEKGRTTLPPLPVTGNATVTATITIVQPGSIQAFNGNTLIPDGSEIYEIAPGGAPRKLWAGHDDIVYALDWTPEGLLAASGNRGRIYRIQDDGSYADIAHLEASQGTGFADSPQGLYVATANSGKLYRLTHNAAIDGTYLSEVFDATAFSQWGRAEVEAASGADLNKLELYARAGNIDNPLRSWGNWHRVEPNTVALGIESSRFVQLKVVLHPGGGINSLGVNYLPVNLPPVVDEVVVAPGARVNAAAMQIAQPQQISIVFPSTQSNAISYTADPGKEPLPAIRDKNAVTARWAAHDDNGDDLIFALYYRGEGERNWQLLKDKITDRYYTFDAVRLPDGPYRMKVIASDAPSHNPGEALTGERESDLFVLDTTPPAVPVLQAQLTQDGIHATFTATDPSAPIARAEYSIDAGPWQYIEPVGKISDSQTERFDFTAPVTQRVPETPPPANPREHVLTVRVYDRYGNVSAAKAIVR